MMKKYILVIVAAFMVLPTSAQFFNFTLRTNNQQLIDEAMSDAFVRIDQFYEICDTTKNEHFGRNEKDYFNIVPYIGIQTERGIIFPSTTLKPWLNDNDFAEYKDVYKPIITKTKISALNGSANKKRDILLSTKDIDVSEHLIALRDSTANLGLKIDTIPGKKQGWLIWLSSNANLLKVDSLKITSIKKDIEIPNDGGYLCIEKPEISENVYGGIYVTPVRSSIGQLTFLLTGIMTLARNEWIIDFSIYRKAKRKHNIDTNKWDKRFE